MAIKLEGRPWSKNTLIGEDSSFLELVLSDFFCRAARTALKDYAWVFLIAVVVLAPSVGEAKKADLDFRTSLTTGYDDNVTLTKENRTEDIVTDILLGLGLTHEGRTHLLDLEVDVTQHLFYENENFNNLSQDMRLRFNKELSPYTRFRLTDTFSNAEEPTSFEDAFGRTSGRYSSRQNKAGIAVLHDFSSRLVGEVHYDNAITTFSRDDLEDTVVHRFGGRADYTYNSATIFNLIYDVTQRRFEEGAKATVNSIAAGVRRYLTPQLYLDLAAGPDYIKAFNGETFTKPHYFAALTTEADENTQFSLTFDKQYATTSSTRDIFNAWRAAANFVRKLTQRSDVYASVFYGKGTYVDLDIEETLQGAYAGFNYELTRNVKAGVGYSFTDAQSEGSDNDYRRNYFFFKVSIAF